VQYFLDVGKRRKRDYANTLLFSGALLADGILLGIDHFSPVTTAGFK